MKAIETFYKGCRFRSRLEARWAVFFDILGVRWEYEKEGFELGGGERYLPDFWLPVEKTWVEIKPKVTVQDQLDIYLAGKMKGWRNGLDLRGHSCTGPYEDKSHNVFCHGSAQDEKQVFVDCLDAIRGSHIVFAWINSFDHYGTLIELGYARALGKKIIIAFEPDFYRKSQNKAQAEYQDHCGNGFPAHALWFVEQAATKAGIFPTPQAGLDSFIPPLSDEERKCAALSPECWLIQGEPWPEAYVIQEFRRGRCVGRNQQFNFSVSKPSNFPPNFPVPESRLYCVSRLFGDSKPLLQRAFTAARSARFEHGDCG